jgi:flagellar hook-associated protein 2
MATIPDSTASSLASSILSSLGSLSGTTSTVGANLNVSALVTQLVAADRAAPQAQITSETNSTNAEVSALGSLMGALGTFQTALQKVADPTAFNANKTTSSNSAVVTATVDSTAGTGSYGVQVVALAQAHQLTSGAFVAGSNSPVGIGTLTIAQGSSSFNVTIDSANSTLSGIAAAINSASGNTGVQATILTEQGGAHLVLTASQTGAASAISVTTADSGLAQLNYNATTRNLTELQPAQDSHIKIANFDHYSATNSVSDAVTGVTFNLQSALPGTTVTVAVTPDTSGTANLVSSFVSAYNQLQSVLSGLDSYDPTSKTAGALLGDATLANIESQLRVDLSNTVSTASGTYNSLASLGVTKQADGSLTLDMTKLNAAMAASPDAVAQIFASGNGIATRLNNHIVTQLQSSGPLSSRNQQLQSTLSDIKTQTSNLDARMAAVQATYTAQFTALETMLAQMQTTSSYLTQQFNALLKTTGN